MLGQVQECRDAAIPCEAWDRILKELNPESPPGPEETCVFGLVYGSLTVALYLSYRSTEGNTDRYLLGQAFLADEDAGPLDNI